MTSHEELEKEIAEVICTASEEALEEYELLRRLMARSAVLTRHVVSHKRRERQAAARLALHQAAYEAKLSELTLAGAITGKNAELRKAQQRKLLVEELDSLGHAEDYLADAKLEDYLADAKLEADIAYLKLEADIAYLHLSSFKQHVRLMEISGGMLAAPLMTQTEDQCCSTCKSIVVADEKFCWRCGAEFDREDDDDPICAGFLLMPMMGSGDDIADPGWSPVAEPKESDDQETA